MNSFFKDPKVITSFACGLVMLAILALMFVPFWTYTGVNEDTFEPEQKVASINGYLWFPSDHNGLEDAFNEYEEGGLNTLYEICPMNLDENGYVEDVDANKIGFPIGFQILFGAFGVALCIWMAKSNAGAYLSIACGLAGIYGYLVVPALRMTSAALWISGLVLACLAIVLGIVRIIIGAKFKDTVASLRA